MVCNFWFRTIGKIVTISLSLRKINPTWLTHVVLGENMQRKLVPTLIMMNISFINQDC